MKLAKSVPARKRRYFPSYAELCDRLTIIVQKELYATDEKMKREFKKERQDIVHDITLFGVDGDLVFANMLLMLCNSKMWDNESAARGDGNKSNFLLTHKLNATRANIKKRIQEMQGGRIDYKLNYLEGEWKIEW